jgi:hypothetical protein
MSGAFTIDSSRPTLKINLIEQPIYPLEKFKFNITLRMKEIYLTKNKYYPDNGVEELKKKKLNLTVHFPQN